MNTLRWSRLDESTERSSGAGLWIQSPPRFLSSLQLYTFCAIWSLPMKCVLLTFFKEVLILTIKELRCPVKFWYKFNWSDFFFKKLLLLTDLLFNGKSKLCFLLEGFSDKPLVLLKNKNQINYCSLHCTSYSKIMSSGFSYLFHWAISSTIFFPVFSCFSFIYLGGKYASTSL